MNHTMQTPINRRDFLKQTSCAIAAATAAALAGCKTMTGGTAPLFRISLAEWSLHRALRDEKTLTNLDFPVVTRRDYGIDGVEFVNQFFMDKAKDMAYLADLKSRCDGEGVKSLIIMCDNEGSLGDPNEARRLQAVENHHKWADAAKYLGCHSIRVNAATGNRGTFEEQQKRAADGLRSLSEHCAKLDLNCIVENHGGLSSNGAWLAGVMSMVDLPNCGTLPDFGNFVVSRGEEYDRYKGVAEMMPFAKAVSAKSHEFDADGNEVRTDYRRMMRIVLGIGYRGWVGVEYEGSSVSEPEGIRATQRLLETVREELESEYA